MTLPNSTSDQDQLKLKVSEASMSLLAELRKAGAKAFKPLGFTHLEAMLLVFVERGHRQFGDLADLLGLVPPALSAMTTKLADSGFLVKEVVQNDNRRILLSLTDGGKVACQKLRTAWDTHSPIDTSAFTDEEISAFIRIGQSLGH